MPDPEYMVPLTLALGDAWPSDLVRPVSESPVGDVLGKIGFVWLEVTAPTDVAATLMLRERLALELPGLAGLEFVFGSRGEHTRLDLALSFAEPFYVGIEDVPIQLRLPRDALHPVIEDPDGRFSADPDPSHVVAIAIRPSIGFSGDGNISLSGLTEIDISVPFMIGDSGLVIEISRIGLHLTEGDPPPDGLPEGWRGVHIERAVLHLPRAIEVEALPGRLELTDCGIGSGGFTGAVAADWSGDPVSAKLVGFTARLKRVAFAFQQNAFRRSAVEGELDLSFFEATVGASLTLGADGQFSVALSAVPDQEEDNTSSETRDGLIIFTRPQLFEMVVESMRVDNVDDVFRFTVGGRLKPLLAGLSWPVIDVKALSIDEHGNVDIEGGWIDLPEQGTLDFHGFKIGITEAGFGTEEDGARQWLGVSGAINLVEGIPLAASVEGLKFSWNREGEPDLDVTLRGIGVHLEIPNALILDGSVAYEELPARDDDLSGHVFRGHVKVDLPSLRMEVGGQLMIGRLRNADGEEFTTFYIVLEADLPTPIPLGSTGTGIYGLAGLFGAHVAPDRHPAEGTPEPWYEWYKAERGTDTAYSVRSVQKWAPRFDYYGFGAGLTLGTQFDDGYSLNVKALAAVLLPGPVVMIEGRADLLAPRTADSEKRGAFYALAVFDGLDSTFQLNVDVAYSLASVIEAGGGLEAFFDFTDPGRWYLHLGKKDPDSKRIQAQILALFRASAYLMIDNRSLQTGAFIGFDWRASLGPVSLSLVARISFDAGIFWKPLQLEGTLLLYGEIALRVFGIGIALVIEALLEGRAPAPYLVCGRFRVELSLPWPLPDVKAAVQLKWEEKDEPSPVDPFLKGVALAHHKQAGAGWSLEEGAETAPSVDSDFPVFPVDIRPVLSFARPIYGLSRSRTDDGDYFPVEEDRVGDYEFSYRLANAILEVYEPEVDDWVVVRQGVREAGGSSGDFVVDKESFALGWDAQEPQLELWRYSALDRSTVYWRESYPDRYPACPTRVVASEHCVDWRFVADGTQYPREFRHQGLRFVAAVFPTHWLAEPEVTAGALAAGALTVRLPEPVAWLAVRVTVWQATRVRMTLYADGERLGERLTDETLTGEHVLQYSEDTPVDSFSLAPDVDHGAVVVLSICYRTVRELRRESATTPPADTGAGSTPEPAPGTLVLAPDTKYRLRIRTATEREPGTSGSSPEHIFYFKTDKGPGTAPADAAHVDTPLNDLGTYVARTLPTHGARSFYYGYDLGIEFNESYVEQMYTAPLRIRLRNRNGHIIGDPEGAWGAGPLPLRPLGLLTWLWAEESGGCGGRTAPPAPGAALSRSAPADLAPDRLYTAEVITAGWETPEEPLYSFQFTTSRYRSAAEHLASGRDETTGEQVVRVLPPGPRPPMDWVTGHRAAVSELEAARGRLDAEISGSDANLVAEELAAVRTVADALDELSAAIFDRLDQGGEGGYSGVHGRFETVGLGHRPLPPALELIQLDIDGSGDKFLLLESPEPLDWDRVTVRCRDSRGDVPIRVLWNRDRTRAFLFRDDDSWFAAGSYTFAFVYSGRRNPELGSITRDGSAVEEAVECVIRLN